MEPAQVSKSARKVGADTFGEKILNYQFLLRTKMPHRIFTRSEWLSLETFQKLVSAEDFLDLCVVYYKATSEFMFLFILRCSLKISLGASKVDLLFARPLAT